MASLLISKSDEKSQTIVTINGHGVFYQELRLGNRPMSPRTRIGKLAVVDSEVMVEYDAWAEYDDLIVRRDTCDRTIKAAKGILDKLDSEAQSRKKAEIEGLEQELLDLDIQIHDHPIHTLSALNAKVMAFADKMLDKVRYKHKHLAQKGGVSFTHYPTKEYFLQRQAEELLKKHNESLEARGIEEGYLDFDAAMARIAARYAQAIAMNQKSSKKKAAV